MKLHIISKTIAKSLGMKFYFTGVACINGGIGLRAVNSSRCRCSICLLKHSEIERQHNKTNKRILTVEQKERKSATNKIYREKNIDIIKEKKRTWKIENPEKIKQQRFDYHKRNPHLARAKRALRRATLKNRTPLWFGEFDKFVINEAAHLCEIRKVATGFDWQVDHMFPLQAKKVSGLHCGINMQVIPRVLNTSKSNRMIFTEPFEWLKSF